MSNPSSSPTINISPESIKEATSEIVDSMGEVVGQVLVSPQVKGREGWISLALDPVDKT